MDTLEAIAATVLYEGYLLWPYRRSARKNQQRWTFGGVYPRGFVETARSGDRHRIRCECLVAGDSPALEVELRFLHVVERRPAHVSTDGSLAYVDELSFSGQRVLAWSEALERRVPPGDIRVATGEDREP